MLGHLEGSDYCKLFTGAFIKVCLKANAQFYNIKSITRSGDEQVRKTVTIITIMTITIKYFDSSCWWSAAINRGLVPTHLTKFIESKSANNKSLYKSVKAYTYNSEL